MTTNGARTALLLLAAGLAGCAGPLVRHEFRADKMGSEFRIVLYAASQSAAREAAEAAFVRADELNAIFSDYDGRSELSRLGRGSGGPPVAVSEELFEVLDLARRVSRASEGAFDVTVGPVVRLWRRARHERRLPTAARRERALAAVGWRHVRLGAAGRTVELPHPGMRLDLGGIAKGWTAAAMLSVLRGHGIGRALVDAGGDLALGAPPPGREGWAVGLTLPAAPGRPPAGPSQSLLLAGCGVATSGDAYRFVEIDGVRYSHIVDPTTGLGLTTPSHVTVVAPDPAVADALASAVSVLGPAKGIALVERFPGASVLVRRIEGEELRTWASRDLPPLGSGRCRSRSSR